MRNTTKLEVWRTSVREHFPAVADSIEDLSIESFAKWRWGTLRNICRPLRHILPTLAKHWQPSLFKNARDPEEIKDVTFALGSPAWHGQFEFMLWYSGWLCGLADWGKGCECCETELMMGVSVDCPRKGRRLREAYPVATARSAAALSECEEFSEGSFGPGVPIEGVKGMVRHTYELAHRKLKHLRSVPYLFARLGEAEIV